ncbi:hypothetical protein Tco_0705762, partial [Tanacetum coccineum]
MTEGNKKQYIADVKVMNYLLQAIPNDIYNSVDACKNDKDMWERIKRLMFGSDVTSHVRHSRLMDEFDKFSAKKGESLEYVYERLTTLVNIMDRTNVCPIPMAINTKFLNCLQPEWSKYVAMDRHNQTGDTVSYDELYDSLVQFEPHVLASKAKKAANNHDPLALLANSNASSSQSHANSSYSTQPYYVTHPHPLLIMKMTRAITQKFSTPTNNLLRTSSNTRNQAVIQDGRVDIQTKNIGYGGNGNMNAGRQNRNQAFNAGHYALDYQKPRVRDAKYFREQMLLAMKDEAGSNLKDKENDFMLNNSYGDETLKELTAALAKKAFKERENRYLDDFVDLEEKLSSHDRIVYKMGQSIQTIHMLGKQPNKVYDPFLKGGLGYKNAERLKKAIAAQPKMYHDEMLYIINLKFDSPDSKETLEDAEESRLKMRNKMVQLNYEKLNALYETFVPQQEPSVKQTYFSFPSTSNDCSESKEVTSDLTIPKMPKE